MLALLASSESPSFDCLYPARYFGSKELTIARSPQMGPWLSGVLLILLSLTTLLLGGQQSIHRGHQIAHGFDASAERLLFGRAQF